MGEAERTVSRNPRGGWDVRINGSKRVSSHHATRADAVAWAMDLVRQGGGGHVFVDDPHDREKIRVERPDDRLLFAAYDAARRVSEGQTS